MNCPGEKRRLRREQEDEKGAGTGKAKETRMSGRRTPAGTTLQHIGGVSTDRGAAKRVQRGPIQQANPVIRQEVGVLASGAGGSFGVGSNRPDR